MVSPSLFELIPAVVYSSSTRGSIEYEVLNGESLMSAGAAIAYVGIYVGALAVAAGIMFTLRLVKLI
jgi:hypothetical protein